MGATEIKCKLCSEPIVEIRSGDHWCYGCKADICDNHIFDPMGGHDIQDHDFVKEER